MLYEVITRLVAVITKKDIEAAGAQNISDLLENVAFADIRTRGPLGVQNDVSVRGGTS